MDSVEPGTPFAEAGIERGDVLLAWRRLPSPPANPGEASGEIESAFDYLWLSIEQAPRGVVELTVDRGGEIRRVEVAPGHWSEIHPLLLPLMPNALFEDYLRGRVHLEAAEAERLWKEVAEGAEDWRVRCFLLMSQGSMHRDWEKALAFYRAALDVAEEDFPRSVIWRAIGRGWAKQGQMESAHQALDKSRELLEGEPETLTLAWSLVRLAKLAEDRGDLIRAIAYNQRALEIYRKVVPQSPQVAAVLLYLGEVASLRGESDQAGAFLEEARAMMAETAGAIDYGKTLTSLGKAASKRGDVDQATEYHLGALKISERQVPGGKDTALILNNLGTAALRREDLEQAEGYLRRALQIWQRLAPRSLDSATTLNNLGALTRQRGELKKAWGFYQRALEIKQQLAPDSLDLAGTLNSIGHLAISRKDAARAKDYLERSLEIRQRLAPDSLDQVGSLVGLGNLAQAAGDLEAAEGYFQQALGIYQRLAPGGLGMPTVLDYLGYLALLRNDLVRAENHHRRAVAILEEKAPLSSDMSNNLKGLGLVAQMRGDFEKAESYFMRSLEVHEKLAPESASVAELYYKLGYLKADMNPPQLIEANRFLSRALHVLESQLTYFGGSHDTRAGFRAAHDHYYRLALAVQYALRRAGAAFRTLERSRARGFIEHLTERDLVFTSDIPAQLDSRRRDLAVLFDQVQRALAGLDEFQHTLQVEAIREALRRLRDEARDLEEEIRAVSPNLAALKYPEPLDAYAARSALDPGTLMLSYSVDRDWSTVFLVSRGEVLVAKNLRVRKATLERQVRQLLDRLAEARSESSLSRRRLSEFQETSRKLYAALLEPVADRIAASERLLILPDGPLHALPFAALMRGDQYLVEWKPIHVALSATVYRELTQRRGDDAADAHRDSVQFVGFGDPLFPQRLTTVRQRGLETDLPADGELRSAVERGVFDWKSLPYTRNEVEAIAGLFPAESVRTFLGAEALEERIKGLDRGTRILHLATHAYTDERLPSNSFVALSIPETVFSETEGPTRDNGLLQVWEIFERVRIDADLVVLSACESGLGKRLGSEGLIGLTRAFQYAGARSVLASLWSVADQTTAELMIRFYRHFRSGLPKDEALRAAQLELLGGPIGVTSGNGQTVRRDVSSPYYWAAFQIYGDWQ